MESVLGRYKNLIVLACVLVAQVLGLAVQVKRTTDTESSRLIRIWAVNTVTPFEKVLHWVHSGSGNLWHNYFYLRGVRAENRELKAEIERARTEGPYGTFPAGPLSVEDKKGPIYRLSDAGRPALGTRLAAALEHAHLLVFRPRDAAPAAMQALLDAGWPTTAIVTLSQLVAFLSFQVRSVAGMRTLGASLGRTAAKAS